MNIRLLILLFCIVTSCSTEMEETVDKILRSEGFEIEMHNEGCFGNYDMYFKIFKDGDKKLFQYPTSLKDPTQTKVTTLTSEKEEILKSFMAEGLKEDNGQLCTGFTKYKVGTRWTKISFEDNSCKMYDYLEQLME